MTTTPSSSFTPSLCAELVLFGGMAFALTMTFAVITMEPGYALLLGLLVGAMADFIVYAIADEASGPSRIARAQHVHQKPHLAPRTPDEIKRRGPAKVEARRRYTPADVERLSYNRYE
nr:hypothetical protein [Candidatus Sigynarchaeota archaeon]